MYLLTLLTAIFALTNLSNASAIPDIGLTLKEYAKIVELSKEGNPEPVKHDPSFYGKDPDIGLSVPELVAKYDYPIEVYDNIKTEDGYLLTVHRIPHGRNNTNIKKRPVVFLMHGLVCSSADWVVTGPSKGLAYILADRGYDVFMGNARGNTYSRKHVKHNPDKNKKKFWDFSWHHIGSHDLPAMIDFALEKTKQKNLFYIGHSQGTTSFFVMTSQKPEYNKKIKLMSALSPVAYMKNTPNPFFQLLARADKILGALLKIIGMHEFLPNLKIFEILGQVVCGGHDIGKFLCTSVLFLIAGANFDQMNTEKLPIILSHTPAGAATNQFLHYAQGIKTGDFKQYDFGFMKNLAKYGKAKPPAYDTSKITAPIALFYGTNDLLASEKDVKQLYRELKNPIILQKLQNFNHLDFLWGKDVDELLYESVISYMQRF